MNPLICHFLSITSHQQIADLFHKCIANPVDGNSYALMYNSQHPQYYFSNLSVPNPVAVHPYAIVGLFSLNEIDNTELLQNAIEKLRKKWCGS